MAQSRGKSHFNLASPWANQISIRPQPVQFRFIAEMIRNLKTQCLQFLNEIFCNVQWRSEMPPDPHTGFPTRRSTVALSAMKRSVPYSSCITAELAARESAARAPRTSEPSDRADGIIPCASAISATTGRSSDVRNACWPRWRPRSRPSHGPDRSQRKL